LGYRIAVIEAFRRRGIYPRDVRTLSVDSLRWQGPQEDLPEPHFVYKLHDLVKTWDLHRDRKTIYEETQQAQRKLHRWIEDWIAAQQAGEVEHLLGIAVTKPDKPEKFEIHSMRPARRIGPDGESVVEMVIEITQRRWVPFDASAAETTDRSLQDGFWFRGGCTIVVNIEDRRIRYAIKKDINRTTRMERQRKFLSGGAVPSLQATYFGNVERDENDATEPFAFLHGSVSEEEIA
jgi:hypothetical protein